MRSKSHVNQVLLYADYGRSHEPVVSYRSKHY